MAEWLRKGGLALALGSALLILAGTANVQADTQTIRAGDWQYAELDKLAQAGVLSGHPKAPLSTWTDSLTRYEAAALTLRAVQGLGAACGEQATALLQVAQAGGAETGPIDEPQAAAPAEPEAAPSLEGLSAENLARVEKLIEEFRAELVTMGARVDYVQSVLSDATSRLAKVEADQKQHKIDGYMQLRFRSDSAPDGKQEFMVRRVRVNVRGPLSERTTYRIEFQLDAKDQYDAAGTSKGTGSKVQLRTATVDYKLGRGKFQLGQAILPWGYELQESVPNLWTGERALWMDRLFPEQRDIGLLWNYRRTPASPQFDLGLVNGTGINATENNDRTNALARVDFPVHSGTVALSTYRGTNGSGSSAKRQDRDGVSTRLKWGQTEFLGEYVQGHDKGSDVRGWYAQLGHPISRKAPNLLFAKYDRYDENLDLAGDMFKRWSLGYWYDIDKGTRLSLVWESRDVESGFSERSKWDGNAYYVQVQTKF